MKFILSLAFLGLLPPCASHATEAYFGFQTGAHHNAFEAKGQPAGSLATELMSKSNPLAPMASFFGGFGKQYGALYIGGDLSLFTDISPTRIKTVYEQFVVGPETYTLTSKQLFGIRPALQIGTWVTKNWKPYALIGFTILREKISQSTLFRKYGKTIQQSQTKTSLAAVLGAGVEHRLNEFWKLRLGYELHIRRPQKLNMSGFLPITIGRRLDQQLTLGVAYLF